MRDPKNVQPGDHVTIEADGEKLDEGEVVEKFDLRDGPGTFLKLEGDDRAYVIGAGGGNLSLADEDE